MKKVETKVEIDMQQMGEFLRNLRKSEGFSQEVLAKHLFVSRQAISLWENGDALPEHESIICICNFFKITADELYKGMYDDPRRQTLLYKILMNKQIQKYKRLLTIFIIFIVLSTIVFSIFTMRYFFIVHNNVRVYNIASESVSADEYQLDGMLSNYVNDINFYLSINKRVDKLCLIYDNKEVLCNTNSNKLTLSDRLGYNEVLPNVSKEYLINNLSLNIYDNNKNKTIKLVLVELFDNKDVIFNKEKDIVNGSDIIPIVNNEVPKKIKETFNYDKEDNKYYLYYAESNKKIELSYFVNLKKYIVKEFFDNKIISYHYYLFENYLDLYNQIENGKLIKAIDNFSDKDTNKEKQEIYNYFERNYLRKYIY